MTHFQQVFLFTTVVAVTVGAGLEGVRWYGRFRTASAAVASRHRGADAGALSRAGEVMREAWNGPRTSETAPVSVAQYDPAAVEELKREGIDLSVAVELRDMMRIALSAEDPAVKMRLCAELKRRFGMEASPELLGKLERAGGTPRLTLTKRGARFVRGIVDGVSGMYGSLLKEVSQ